MRFQEPLINVLCNDGLKNFVAVTKDLKINERINWKLDVGMKESICRRLKSQKSLTNNELNKKTKTLLLSFLQIIFNAINTFLNFIVTGTKIKYSVRLNG